MEKSEQKIIVRLASWSDWDNYFDDVYRTLVHTGTVSVCRDDIFKVNQRLKRLGIISDSLTIKSDYRRKHIK
jgi:hypothetical protein